MSANERKPDRTGVTLLRRRNLCLALGTVVIGGLAYAGARRWGGIQRPHAEGAIPVRGGRSLERILPGAESAFYSQKDPRWADDGIGGSGARLRDVGCTLCSVAMATTALGYAISPPELNRRLSAQAGFTERGWLVWGALRAAVDHRAEAVVYASPSHARIDTCLERGEIPIVKFFLRGGIPHWVMVAGKAGNDYLVNDPGQSRPGLTRLSRRADAIHALRVIRGTIRGTSAASFIQSVE